MYRRFDVLAKAAEIAARRRDRRKTRQHDIAVAADGAAEIVVLLTAQRHRDLVSRAKDVIVGHRAGLRHGDLARLAKLIVTKLAQLYAGARRQDLLQARGRLAIHRGGELGLQYLAL